MEIWGIDDVFSIYNVVLVVLDLMFIWKIMIEDILFKLFKI